MMTRIFLTLLIGAITYSSHAQPSLAAFDNLVGSTWISTGKQLGGHEGKTEKEFMWGLDGKIVKVKTFTTDPTTLEFGLRNEGIRAWNAQSGKIEFYEFDKLGGISQGVVIIEEKTIHYQYSYGDLILRDSWTYIDENEYTYTVASMVNEKPDKIYHTGTFKRK